MTEQQRYSIGELAERAGVTPRTIRYYVQSGLLSAPARAGKFHVYGREHYVTLRLIRRLQRQHIPLRSIRERLEGLSLDDLEGLLSLSEQAETKRLSTPPPDPRWLLASVLSGTAPAPEAEAEALSGPALAATAAPAAPAFLAAARDVSRESTAWRRVVVAPGLEIHYEVPGSPGAQTKIDDIARYAARRWSQDG